ncbi:hypothetical protein [Bernardetia sp.]|uniref:hypothetical protein n=1 Tax=Bernardetia sp. TaxID=1937974 RepID=UPI0025C6B5E6|nr:hypothetical protein [Bernardetia sp.]
MQSLKFKSLIIGLYISLGIMLVPPFHYALVFLVDKLWWFTENTQNLITLIFFVILFLSIFLATKFKSLAVFFVTLFGLASIFAIFILGLTKGDKAVFYIMLFSTLVLMYSLIYHPSFKKEKEVLNNDSILDDFDIQEKSSFKEKPSYFLRVHRIFSFIIVCAGLGLIFLGTVMTGGHISTEEGLGLVALSIPVFIIAFLNWKFPKVFSYLVAISIFFGGGFLELAIFEQMQRAITTSFVNPTFLIQQAFIMGQIGFVLSCIFMICIVLSKTAREEWKMK